LEREAFQLDRIDNGLKGVPDPPESYVMKRRLESLKLSFFAGGYVDQPYLLLLAFQAAEAGEQDYVTIQRINAQTRASNS
jgi:hypothetical protein